MVSGPALMARTASCGSSACFADRDLYCQHLELDPEADSMRFTEPDVRCRRRVATKSREGFVPEDSARIEMDHGLEDHRDGPSVQRLQDARPDVCPVCDLGIEHCLYEPALHRVQAPAWRGHEVSGVGILDLEKLPGNPVDVGGSPDHDAHERRKVAQYRPISLSEGARLG